MEDFRATLDTSYDLTDAFSGVCTLCTTRDRPQELEVYRHRELPRVYALFCPACGSLFQVDLSRTNE